MFENIKAQDTLPSPSGVALAIMRVANNPSSTIDELTAVAEMDPATAARILKYVNSPFAGVARKVASLQQGILLLGKQTVVNLALGYSLMTAKTGKRCAQFDYQSYWAGCIARATVARHMADKLGLLSPNDAFTCGLLSQIGKLGLVTVYPDEYAQILDMINAHDDQELLAMEHEVFEINHDELTAAMLADWQLPEIFCEAVRMQSTVQNIDAELDQQSDAQQLAHLLHMGSLLTPVFMQWQFQQNHLAAIISSANRLHVEPITFSTMFDNIGQEWQDIGQIFSVPTRRVSPWAQVYSMAN